MKFWHFEIRNFHNRIMHHLLLEDSSSLEILISYFSQSCRCQAFLAIGHRQQFRQAIKSMGSKSQTLTSMLLID